MATQDTQPDPPSDLGLLPYQGEELERLRQLGRSHVCRTFGADHGGRTYRFNRLGYRGDEVDATASHRVFVFGESHAFGYFVEEEEAWPAHFVRRWCDHHRLPSQRVNVLNFADPGSSNASIARMVVSQCSTLRPDLVLVHFADIRRSEVLLDGRPHRIGPWLLDDTSAEAAAKAPAHLPETLNELIARGTAYFRHSLGPSGPGQWQGIDPTCLLEALREILLVQSFCRAAGIPLVATCEHMEELRKLRPEDDPVLAPLVQALDADVLASFDIWSVGRRTARTSERASGHAAPRRHRTFAKALFDFYLKRRSAAVPPPRDLDATTSTATPSTGPPSVKTRLAAARLWATLWG